MAQLVRLWWLSCLLVIGSCTSYVPVGARCGSCGHGGCITWNAAIGECDSMPILPTGCSAPHFRYYVLHEIDSSEYHLTPYEQSSCDYPYGQLEYTLSNETCGLDSDVCNVFYLAEETRSLVINKMWKEHTVLMLALVVVGWGVLIFGIWGVYVIGKRLVKCCDDTIEEERTRIYGFPPISSYTEEELRTPFSPQTPIKSL